MKLSATGSKKSFSHLQSGTDIAEYIVRSKRKERSSSKKSCSCNHAEDSLIVHFVKMKKFFSYVGEVTTHAPNLVKRNFHADAPNKLWLTDITESTSQCTKSTHLP